MLGKRLTAFTVVSASIFIGSTACFAVPEGDAQQVDKEAIKNSNISEAQKLNGTAPADKAPAAKNTKTAEVGGASRNPAKQKEEANKTASVVNQVPGVKVAKEDLQPPTSPVIKGFHPIKKLLQPVENLEGMSIKLEQQIMKLEGPIAALNPPMVNLQKKMTNMQGQLGTVQGQMTGVRSDIGAMRKDIESLRGPIEHIEGPIGSLAKPLEALEMRLNMILGAILFAALAIAVGTPVAAVLLYKHRHKLGVSDQELPKAAQPAGTPTPAPRGGY